MVDGNLKLGLADEDAFWDLLEGRKRARSGARPVGLYPGSAMGQPRAGQGASGHQARPRLSQSQRLAKLLRVAQRAPEVMVKVTGKDQSVKQLRAHLAYLGREEDAQAELNDGQRLYGREAIRSASDLIPDSRDPQDPKQTERALSLHVMFSMPAGTATAAQVHDAARDAASVLFRDHEYLTVLHEDKPHKHVHLVVAISSHSGRQLRHYKPQLQQWRETFAEALRERGVVAEATPRVIRGIGERGVDRSVRAIRDKRARAKQAGLPVPSPARTDADKVAQLVREIERERAGQGTSDRPWERAIARNRDIVQAGWAQLQDELRRGGIAEQGQASVIESFVKDMPRSATLRDRQLDALQKASEQRTEKAIDPVPER